jgi:hypothetical protein
VKEVKVASEPRALPKVLGNPTERDSAYLTSIAD